MITKPPPKLSAPTLNAVQTSEACRAAPPARLHDGGARSRAARTATAATAAPPPAPAARTQSGGVDDRKSAASAMITTRPGTIKPAPPTSAPGHPPTRPAQKMASWVDE